MSKNTINYILAFSIGAAAGAVVSWKMLKNKYERIADDEIREMREYYKNKNREAAPVQEVQEEPAQPFTADEKETFAELVEQYSAKGKEENLEMINKPYVITPEDFGTLDDYEVHSLTYYDDGVLTNELEEVVDDVERLVGYDAFNHFGEYEDDAVFVRNDVLKVDYEILYDPRNYSDVAEA